MDNAQMTLTLSQLRLTRDCYRKELKDLPPGYLSSSTKGRATRYYHVVQRNGVRFRHGITHDEETIFALARKKYLTTALNAIDHDIQVLSTALTDYIPINLDHFVDTLPATYKQLPREAFYDAHCDPALLHTEDVAQRIASHAAWGTEPYERSAYRPEELKLTTRHGISMRSKTEVFLANELDAHGIYYRYEQPIYLDVIDQVAIPDFTLEGAGGHLFFIEAFGMMNNESYAQDHITKLQRYLAAGIVPGVNLICYYEANNQLDLRRIEAIVELEVIPRL